MQRCVNDKTARDWTGQNRTFKPQEETRTRTTGTKTKIRTRTRTGTRTGKEGKGALFFSSGINLCICACGVVQMVVVFALENMHAISGFKPGLTSIPEHA